MITFKISNAEWEVLRVKLKRKYNALSDEDLQFEEGQEEQLVARLAERLRRTKDYVFFTLSKGLIDLSGNRL